MKNQFAFTLLEMLLVISISSMVMFGLVQAYLQFKQTSHMIEALNAIQERGRYAYLLFANAVRSAGSSDCFDQEKSKHKLEAKVRGYSADTLPLRWQIHARRGTDAILLSGCYPKNNKFVFLKKVYFIGDTHRVNKNKQSIYALYEKNLPGHARELITHVSNMKIKYGIANTNNAKNENQNSVLYYLTAAKLKNWFQVISVKISLLLHSDIITKMNAYYWFEQHQFNLKDNDFYQPVTVYFAFRNR